MPRRILILRLLAAVMLLLGLVTHPLLADQTDQPKEDYYELHKLLVDTLDQVERNYVKNVSRRELIEAAIRGVLRELDPYSSYISPDDVDQFRSAVDSEFGGVGIQVSTERGFLEVVSPMVGTPAYRAGILAGDRIVQIDGQSTEGLDLDAVVRRVKGEEGTQVTLTVIHRGKSEPEKITITREVIHVRTVLGDHRNDNQQWDYMLDGNKQIGYIRITAFSRNTARELREALTDLKNNNLRGLILDLRFNPGGLLRSAIEVSDLFLAEGRIVATKGKDPADSERSWDAHKQGTFDGFPMAVLVNRYSASASEIVSACLQDHERAIIVGERTWGKGSVQNVIPLEQGRSVLKLTTATYYRPNGENIHRFPNAKNDAKWGVTPDKEFRRKLTDKEMIALDRYRRKRDVLRPKQPQAAAAAESAQEPPEPSAKDEPAKTEPGAPHQADPPQQPADDAPPEPADSEFVDLQLQMALDYLSGELARADAVPPH